MSRLFHYFSGRTLILLLIFICPACAASSELPGDATPEASVLPAGESPARFVEESFLMEQIRQLASDDMMGRGTGQSGSQRAVDYLEQYYTSGSFSEFDGLSVVRQSFLLEGVFWDAVSYDVYRVDAGDTVYLSRAMLEKGSGADFFPLSNGTRAYDAPVVFAGDGVFDLPVRDVRSALQNSWVMMFEPESGRDGSRSSDVHKMTTKYGATGVIFIPVDDTQPWREKSLEMSRQLERPTLVRRPDERYSGSGGSAGVSVSVRPDLAVSMLSLENYAELDSLRRHWQNSSSSLMPRDTGYRFRSTPSLNVRTFEEDNLFTVIPGRDVELSREMLVLTAHYDHLGLGEPDDSNDLVYSGADDNASGTAVLMQVAQAFHEAAGAGYHPSRTLVFLHTAAEEWGLHGARYFVDNNPFPDHEIVANVNVDMVGSVDDIYSGQEDSSYVYVIGAGLVSTLLDDLVRSANEATTKLNLDEVYNDTGHYLQLYRRSDHWPFALRNIPFVFFFSGLHEHYHKPSDTPEKIAIAQLAARAELITELVWYLSEVKERPESDRQRFGRNRIPAR